MAEQTVTIQVPDAPAAIAAAPAATPKQGALSTEFGATIVTGVALALGAVPPQYGPIVAGLVGVYVACRTLLKAAHVLGYAKQVPDLPDLPVGAVRQVTTTTQVQP